MINKKIIAIMFVTLLLGVICGNIVASRQTIISTDALNDLSDVDTTGLAVDKILKYNGTMWAIADDETGGGGTGYWDRSGTTLFTHTNNDNVQVNGTFQANAVTSTFFGDGKNLTIALNNLSDVNINPLNLYNNQQLTYDTGKGSWYNKNSSVYWSRNPSLGRLYPIIGTDSVYINNTVNAGQITTSMIDTGQGYVECFGMNQDVKTTNGVTFATVNTGQGANELYDMNQNVMTTSSVLFDDIRADDDLTVDDDASVGSVLDVATEIRLGDSPTGKFGYPFINAHGALFLQANPDFVSGLTEGRGLHIYHVAETGFLRSIFIEEETLKAYLPMTYEASNYIWCTGVDDVKSTDDMNLIYDNERSFLGVGVATPTTRIMLPEDEEGGTGTAYDWVTYSDERIKHWITELPENAVKRFCENVSIQRYNPINTSRDSEGNIIFNDSWDNTKVDVGISAQDLYEYVNNSFNEKYANSVVHKPDNEDKTLWTVSYRNVNMIFARMVQINHERITNMENWLIQYGYDPDTIY